MVTPTPSTDGAPLAGTGLQVLELVHRHRLMTPEAIHRLVYPGGSFESARTVLQRLRRAGYLASAHLMPGDDSGPPRAYYYLTRKACREFFGDSERAGRALSAQGLADAYGVMAFCCLEEQVRRKFTPAEFLQEYPDLHFRGNRAYMYYVDEHDGASRLGYIIVDHGADYRRIIQKCRKILVRRTLRHEAWHRFVAADRFMLAVVTVHTFKAQRIANALKSAGPELQSIIVRLCVRPELMHLI